MAIRLAGKYTITGAGSGSKTAGVDGVIGTFLDSSPQGNADTDVLVGDKVYAQLPDGSAWRWNIATINSTGPLNVDLVFDDDGTDFPAAFENSAIIPSEGAIVRGNFVPSFTVYNIPEAIQSAIIASQQLDSVTGNRDITLIDSGDQVSTVSAGSTPESAMAAINQALIDVGVGGRVQVPNLDATGVLVTQDQRILELDRTHIRRTTTGGAALENTSDLFTVRGTGIFEHTLDDGTEQPQIDRGVNNKAVGGNKILDLECDKVIARGESCGALTTGIDGTTATNMVLAIVNEAISHQYDAVQIDNGSSRMSVGRAIALGPTSSNAIEATPSTGSTNVVYIQECIHAATGTATGLASAVLVSGSSGDLSLTIGSVIGNNDSFPPVTVTSSPKANVSIGSVRSTSGLQPAAFISDARVEIGNVWVAGDVPAIVCSTKAQIEVGLLDGVGITSATPIISVENVNSVTTGVSAVVGYRTIAKTYLAAAEFAVGFSDVLTTGVEADVDFSHRVPHPDHVDWANIRDVSGRMTAHGQGSEVEMLTYTAPVDGMTFVVLYTTDSGSWPVGNYTFDSVGGWVQDA